MAWQRCGKHLVQRNNNYRALILRAGEAGFSMPALIPSSIALVPSMRVQPRQQRQRYLHNRLQSAWDAAKGNVARVPSLLPSRARYEMSFCRKFTTLVVLGGTGIGGLTIYDDYLIFQQCSKRALEKANSDPTLKTILGENIEQGPWYEATMAVDPEGHSAMCHFPVSGSLCNANIHLRAVRYEETNSFMSYFVLPGSGEWELLVLEALIHRPDQPNPQRIDLLGHDNFAPGCAR